MKVGEIVKNVVQEVVDTLPESDRFIVDNKTILFGNGSEIDSMTLVSVIVDLEEILADQYDKEMCLTDDRAMTREISPFDTIQTLVDYIEELSKQI
ncbi:MAG: hypothetical protein O2887_03775 [Bacteroidetes bacterium]|nr:hypothetical protein [Bacteroidota bacterium]MDA1119605.1 hypothetical protein [Bacteroidota bacterium]